MPRKPGKSDPVGKPESAGEAPGFEAALANLEKIVAELESGQLSLTDSIQRYEQGVRMLRHCHTALGDAEQKIRLLTGVDEQGAALTRPFEPSATATESGEAAGNSCNESNHPEGTDGTSGRLF